MNATIEAMLQKIYAMQGTDGSINEELVNYYAGKLWAGVMQGYGIDEAGITYESPDANMLKALKENVWQFAAAKNYEELREMSDALLDEAGNLVSFEKFREKAMLISDKHMKTWLRTEYDLAVAGGQMAGKWVDISKYAATLPYLQFDAVMDNQTTQLCQSLNGTILPVGHPFWNRFYPPNHFNCRSTVRQLASGVVTAEDKIPSADIPPMFQTNLGQRGLIFPPGHAYFVGIPDSVLNQVQPK